MLRRGARHGLHLPVGWETRFGENPASPMIGCRTGIARLFIFRRPRKTGYGDGETVHLSIRDRMRSVKGYSPKARTAEQPESED